MQRGRKKPGPKKGSKHKPKTLDPKPKPGRIPDNVGLRTGHVFGPKDLEKGILVMTEEYAKYVKELLKNEAAEDDFKIKAVEVFAKLANVARGRGSGGNGNNKGGRPKKPPGPVEDDGHGDKEYLDSLQG